MGNFFLDELADANKIPYEGISNLTTILLGLGVVFAGLIILIIVCTISGAILKRTAKPVKADPGNVKISETNDLIQNKGEFVAAVSAAIAEATGTDITGLRILKIEKRK